MRRRGARRRARRLFGGVPRRRPRHEDGAGRALSDARRRVPERGLHSVQGAAAHRGGHGRRALARVARHLVRRAEGRPRQAARFQGQGGRQADRRPRRHGEDAQGDGGAGRRQRSLDKNRLQVGRQDHPLQLRDHRRGLAGGEAAVPAGRSAHRRFDRRARAAQPAEEAAGDRRRHHRPGDGHGVLDARRAPRRGRDDGRPDARRRPRPGRGVAEVQRRALRQGDAQDEDHQGRSREGRPEGDLRRRRSRSRPTT